MESRHNDCLSVLTVGSSFIKSEFGQNHFLTTEPKLQNLPTGLLATISVTDFLKVCTVQVQY
jgi:hypothetical protein